jgi:basic membrane lipoprotein Med (substrate-binding protein (PBP1-ABC) superfamily)
MRLGAAIMHLLARKAVIAAVLFSLCGTLVVSVESGVASAGGTKKVVATWLYTGPKNDGGYNTSQELAMNAMAKLPNVKSTGIYNLGYTAQTGSIITQAIAKGTNVIVDTMGLGSILTNICKKNPKVYCYSGGDTSAQPANSTSFWLPDWNLGYTAGVAAGLMIRASCWTSTPTRSGVRVSTRSARSRSCSTVVTSTRPRRPRQSRPSSVRAWT